MKRYWVTFAVVILASFTVLAWVGSRIHQEAPPIPVRVVTTEGTEVPEPGTGCVAPISHVSVVARCRINAA